MSFVLLIKIYILTFLTPAAIFRSPFVEQQESNIFCGLFFSVLLSYLATICPLWKGAAHKKAFYLLAQAVGVVNYGAL